MFLWLWVLNGPKTKTKQTNSAPPTQNKETFFNLKLQTRNDTFFPLPASIFHLPTSDFHLHQKDTIPKKGIASGEFLSCLPLSNFWLPAFVYYFLPTVVFSHLLSSIFQLPASIFRLPSSIFHLPSSHFHLPTSIPIWLYHNNPYFYTLST